MAGWWPWCCCDSTCPTCDGVFADSLASAPSPDTYNESNSITGGNAPNWFYRDGKLVCENSSSGSDDHRGIRTQSIARPALDGLVLSVAATIHNNRSYLDAPETSGYGATGVCIGPGFGSSDPWCLLLVDWDVFDDQGYHRLSINHSGSGSTQQSFIDLPAYYETPPRDQIEWRLQLELRDVSDGAGEYEMHSYVDGGLYDTRTVIFASLPSSIEMGLLASYGGTFSCLCIDARTE